MYDAKHFTYALSFLFVAALLHSYFYTHFTGRELEPQLKLPRLFKNLEITLGSGWSGSNRHTNPPHCCVLVQIHAFSVCQLYMNIEKEQ